VCVCVSGRNNSIENRFEYFDITCIVNFGLFVLLSKRVDRVRDTNDTGRDER